MGKITEEIKYKDGTPLTKVVYTYYDNKKLKEQSNWKYFGNEWNWQKDDSKLYYESGQIKEEIGVNVHKKWNENGQIIYHHDYNNLTEEWYDNGQHKVLKNKLSYQRWIASGQLIKEHIFKDSIIKTWDEQGDLISEISIKKPKKVEFLPSALWVKERAEEGFFDGWVCEIDNNNNLTGELSEVGKNLIKNEYNLEAGQYFWSFVKENLGKDFENKPKEYETQIWDSMYAYFNCWQCKKEKKDACIGSVREK